jgi:hypothetical protein
MICVLLFLICVLLFLICVNPSNQCHLCAKILICKTKNQNKTSDLLQNRAAGWKR